MSDDPDRPDTTDLKRRIGTGAVWIIISRWGVRSLGLISTLILARLLMPEDFGLIAMASAVYAAVSSLGSLGTQTVLVSLRDIDDHHFNTAWTISLLTGVLIALTIYFAAPLAAGYYNEPRVTFILQWMSLGAVLSHAVNPKLALLLKRLEFSRDFSYLLTSKLLSVGVTTTAAFWLGDYRALVLGSIASSAIAATLSYLYVPYLPRPDLSARKEILGFSIWLLLRNVSFMGMNKLDQAIIGPFFGPAQLSFYYMGSELGNMLTGEVGMPLGRALLPGYALVHDQKDRLQRALRISFAAVLVVLPLGFGLCAVADPLIVLLLGAKWAAAAPLFGMMCIAGALRVLRSPFGPMFLATGYVRAIALISSGGALALALGAWQLAGLRALEVIALLQIAIRSLMLIAVMLLARSACGIGVAALVSMFMRVLLSSLVMLIALQQVSEHLALPLFLQIAALGLLGVGIFALVQSILWLLSSRPFGPETLTLDVLAKLRKKATRS